MNKLDLQTLCVCLSTFPPHSNMFFLHFLLILLSIVSLSCVSWWIFVISFHLVFTSVRLKVVSSSSSFSLVSSSSSLSFLTHGQPFSLFIWLSSSPPSDGVSHTQCLSFFLFRRLHTDPLISSQQCIGFTFEMTCHPSRSPRRALLSDLMSCTSFLPSYFPLF